MKESDRLVLRTVSVWGALIALTALASRILYGADGFAGWPWLRVALLTSTLTCLWAYVFWFRRAVGDKNPGLKTVLFMSLVAPIDFVMVYPGHPAESRSDPISSLLLFLTVVFLHTGGFSIIQGGVERFVAMEED